MRKGDRAELKIKKALRAGENWENNTWNCEVLYLDEKEECLYFLLKEGGLEELSLDCIYECTVQSSGVETKCTGRIRERYNGQNGKTLKFLIENGFYKINVKSVDKQIG